MRAAIPLVLVASACATRSRPTLTPVEIEASRTQCESRMAVEHDALLEKVLRRMERKQQASASRPAPAPLTIDFLAISGGGAWGAFGAAFLCGWSDIKDPELALPEFDIVAGTSTGALIAPFAFLGDQASRERVLEVYRNPKEDWAQVRGVLPILFGTESFVDNSGLRRDVEAELTPAIVQRIAEASRQGRVLCINATNVDHGRMRLWDVGAEAEAAAGGDARRVLDIMLASSAIPGAFPPIEIDGILYADGAVTSNIVYATGLRKADGLVATWQKRNPGVPFPRIRFWVIFNNLMRAKPKVVPPTWTSVVGASLSLSTRAATLTSLRHLESEVAFLRQTGIDAQFRFVAIPDSWAPPEEEEIFDKRTMEQLSEIGRRMGADSKSWLTEVPGQ